MSKLTPVPMDPGAGEALEVPTDFRDAVSLARGSAWLLANPSDPGYAVDHVGRLLDLLGRRGYGDTEDGRFELDFRARFSKAALASIRWWIAKRKPYTPVQMLRRGYGPLQCLPVHALVLLIFLDVTPESFFATGLPE